MYTYKVLRILIVVVYALLVAGAVVLPLYMRALEPYVSGSTAGDVVPRGLLWGQFGYARVGVLTVVASPIYWFFAAMILAASGPKDTEP